MAIDGESARQKPSLRRRGHADSAVRSQSYLFSQLIPYIGNKRRLLPLIGEAVAKTGVGSGCFADLFAGSGVVSRFAKQTGFTVLANDWEPYAFEIGNCVIGCNTQPLFEQLGGAVRVFETLNGLAPIDGYVATHLCPADDAKPDVKRERMFFTRANGGKIDAIRERVAEWDAAGLLSSAERSTILGPLMFAVSYASNTSGVFKGFHNGWGGQTGTALYRIRGNLELRMPVLFDNNRDNRVWRLDAQSAADTLAADRIVLDIAYLDPPYNQHPYGSNYHVLNTVALWDKPSLSRFIEAGGKSAIRTDWRTERRSAYNSRTGAADAFERLLASLSARFILISYSTDGNIALSDLVSRAARRGRLACVTNPYKRYRVSTQRMSAKPMNAEFVLIVDTSDTSTRANAGEICSTILRVEEAALRLHPENAAADVQLSWDDMDPGTPNAGAPADASS